MQQSANLRCQLLHDRLLHPHSPPRGTRCQRRGHTSLWRGACHGNGNRRRGRWVCFHFWMPGLGRRSWKTAKGNVSMQQHWCMITRQHLHTWRTQFLALFACAQPGDPAGPQRSIGQLHGWSGGVASTRLLLGFFLRLRASALCRLAAGQSLGYSGPLGFGRGAGEEVVRPGDVGLRRVAPV
jgi:hypothetical protein